MPKIAPVESPLPALFRGFLQGSDGRRLFVVAELDITATLTASATTPPFIGTVRSANGAGLTVAAELTSPIAAAIAAAFAA